MAHRGSFTAEPDSAALCHVPAMRGRAVWLAAGVVAVFLVHAVWLAGVAEDAFISFRFARNLVAGHGLVWNPGEAPVEGYTNFLWVLLAAGALELGLDPARAAQALGVAASLATFFYVWRTGTRLLGWSAVEALLPCAVLAVSGPFATWAAAGLETNLFTCFAVAGLHHVAVDAKEGRAGERWAGWLALLLAMLTRPEGALVYGLALAGAGLAARRRGAAALRGLALPVAATLGAFAVYFAWRWRLFGQLLPNTFYAKTGGGLDQQLRGARYVGLFAFHYLAPWLPLVALSLARRGGGEPAAARQVLAGAAAVALAWAAYLVWVGGDYMAMYRFAVPAVPFLAVLIGAAARRALAGWPAASAGSRAALSAALAAGVLGSLVHSTPLEARLFDPPRFMHGNWRGVETERWHVARLTAIGRFFAGHARAADESLATDAIGAIGWYSGIAIRDVHGLVDPEIAHRRDDRVGRGFPGHERIDLVGALAGRPTFVMFTRELEPRRPRRIGLPADAAAAYRLESVWLEDPGNGEAGWFSFLERIDRAPAPGAQPPAPSD
jgi:arabinofuranosyltransferase